MQKKTEVSAADVQNAAADAIKTSRNLVGLRYKTCKSVHSSFTKIHGGNFQGMAAYCK